MNQRSAAIAACVIAVLGLGVLGVLALGRDDEPRELVTGTAADPDDDADTDAELPSGNGWQHRPSGSWARATAPGRRAGPARGGPAH